MKKYELFVFEDEINEYVAFLKTTEDLYFFQQEIIKELNERKIEIKNVLVDLFLRNGHTFNRYILLKFDEKRVKSYIINPREVSEKIKDKINEYLKKNDNLLYSSSLSRKEIEFIIDN